MRPVYPLPPRPPEGTHAWAASWGDRGAAWRSSPRHPPAPLRPGPQSPVTTPVTAASCGCSRVGVRRQQLKPSSSRDPAGCVTPQHCPTGLPCPLLTPSPGTCLPRWVGLTFSQVSLPGSCCSAGVRLGVNRAWGAVGGCSESQPGTLRAFRTQGNEQSSQGRNCRRVSGQEQGSTLEGRPAELG